MKTNGSQTRSIFPFPKRFVLSVDVAMIFLCLGFSSPVSTPVTIQTVLQAVCVCARHLLPIILEFRCLQTCSVSVNLQFVVELSYQLYPTHSRWSNGNYSSCSSLRSLDLITTHEPKKPRKLHAIVIKHVISLIFVNAICIFALHGNDLLGIQEVWIITLLCKKSKNFTPALTLQNSPFQAHSIKFQQYRVLRDLKPIIHWKECFSLLFKCVFVSILHWKRRRKWSRHAC